MNKIILFPLLIMFMLALFGTTLAVTDNPVEDEELPTGEPKGEWVQTYRTQPWNWFNYETEKYYPAEGTGEWLGDYFNPSAPENQGKSFQLYNRDTGKWEWYNNYDQFYAVYGPEGSGGGGSSNGATNLFDTNALWVLVAGLLTAGIVLGVQIFGNGLSEWTQYMIFIHGAYGAFWLFLTAGAYNLLIEGKVLGVFGNLIYISLTLLYIVGIITETSGGGAD